MNSITRSSAPLVLLLALSVAVGTPTRARAGGPQPDTREDDFAHVCRSGPNAGDACSIADADTDCPRSDCIVAALGKPIPATLTVLAHDAVTDWSTGASGFQALTLLLEVRGPDGTREMLAATYQDLLAPQNPPTAPGTVVVLPMDETALRDLAPAVGGLLFVQPESRLAAQLQRIFGSPGAPALVFTDRRVQLADHTGDALATVVRFKVRIRFLVPAS
jgi:hypothetical protein